MYHFLREIASLKLNLKVCDAIPATLYVVSEENAAINDNNRFTEKFNFEFAFNLPLSVSIGNTGVTGRVTLFLTTGMSRFFAKLGLNSTSCAGADPGFFLGGGALVSCSTSTPINHIVFFFFFFCRIPVVLENRRSSQGVGLRTPCTLPLDPPLLRPT